jgi:hypothetical protein
MPELVRSLETPGRRRFRPFSSGAVLIDEVTPQALAMYLNRRDTIACGLAGCVPATGGRTAEPGGDMLSARTIEDDTGFPL